MRLVAHGTITDDTRVRIEAEVSGQQNLQDMMAWALSQPNGTFLPRVVAEVVVQDEYTHDVLVPRSDGLVLVYDTT